MSETIQADSPWKEALERYFPQFMMFFFPQAYAAIDWQREWTFLDKELEQIVRDAELGRRLVDKLVQVWSTTGAETWILLHIEVQGRAESAFAQRMYTYHYRISDRYDRPVASFAVLTDESQTWRPNHYHYALLGTQLHFEFTIVKLLDFKPQLVALEQDPNPFAVVIASHLHAQATRKNPESRLHWKLRLVKGLYERGFERSDILELFRIIDWLLALPEEFEQQFAIDLSTFEEERKMPYITSIERRGLERGLQQGLEQGLQQGLERGLQQGLERGKIEVVRQMLRRQIPIALIADCTGLTIEEIEALPTDDTNKIDR